MTMPTSDAEEITSSRSALNLLFGSQSLQLSTENLKKSSSNGKAINGIAGAGKVASQSSDGEIPKKKSRYTKTQWATLITLAFGNFSIGACLSLQAPFFPKEAEQKGATPTEYGLIFGVYQLTIFLVAPIMGKVIAYIQPKLLLNIGILTVGITAVIFGLLDYVMGRNMFVGLAFTVRILEGVGAASMRTASYAIIASVFSEKMSTTFAMLETFLGIGLITGPTLGGALYDLGGFGLPFYVVGSLVLCDAAVILIVLPSPKRAEGRGQGNMLKFWLNPAILIYTFSVFTTFNYIGFNQATLEPHLRQFDLQNIFLGMMFALAGLMYAVTAPAWGWLCDKKCDYRVLSILGCVIMIISLSLIGPMPFLHIKRQVGITIGALVLMGIATGAKLVCAFTGSLRDTIARGFPGDFTTYGLISSMFASSQSLGAFVGPSLGGYLLETVGYDNATWVVLGFEITLAVVLVIYTITVKIRENREEGNDPEDPEEKRPIMNGGSKIASYS